MAVTKIRKMSSWTLLIVSLISIVVLGMFFGGGITNPGEEMKEYVYTGLLLNWTSALFFVTIICMVLFAVWQFITLLKVNPKSALSALVLYSAKASRSKNTQGMSVPPSGTLHALVLWRHYTAPFRKRKGVLQNLSAGCVHFCGLSNVAPKKSPDFCTISIHERISLFNKYT